MRATADACAELFPTVTRSEPPWIGIRSTSWMRRSCRRNDPQYRDGRLGVVREQVAVIAGDLDHQALRPKLALADQAGDQRPRVPQHGIGERREIAVVGKQLRRRNGLCDLDKRARRTKREVEWIERLRLAELFPGQQC